MINSHLNRTALYKIAISDLTSFYIFDKSYQEQHRESDLVVVVEAVEAGAPFLGAG